MTIPAPEALELLREGNRRFAAGEPLQAAVVDPSRRAALAAGQAPLAVVLGCADSRVPVDLVFDRGPGDLFVVRVAGNVAGLSQIGSIEYAVEQLGTRLVVVLGHTGCGAVAAAVDDLRRPSADLSPGLRCVLDQIRPVVEELLAAEPGLDSGTLARLAVRTNVSLAVDRIRHDSGIIARLIRQDGLLVVGAEYSLVTGIVDFFNGAPGTG